MRDNTIIGVGEVQEIKFESERNILKVKNNMGYQVEVEVASITLQDAFMLLEKTIKQKKQWIYMLYLNPEKTRALYLGTIYCIGNGSPLVMDSKSKKLSLTLGDTLNIGFDINRKNLEIKMGKTGQEDIFLWDQNKKQYSLTLSDKQTKFTIDANKGSYTLAAKQEIKHSVMQSSSQINTSGINIKTNSNLNLKGMNAILNAQAQAKVSGATVMAKGSGSTMLG